MNRGLELIRQGSTKIETYRTSGPSSTKKYGGKTEGGKRGREGRQRERWNSANKVVLMVRDRQKTMGGRKRSSGRGLGV